MLHPMRCQSTTLPNHQPGARAALVATSRGASDTGLSALVPSAMAIARHPCAAAAKEGQTGPVHRFFAPPILPRPVHLLSTQNVHTDRPHSFHKPSSIVHSHLAVHDRLAPKSSPHPPCFHRPSSLPHLTHPATHRPQILTQPHRAHAELFVTRRRPSTRQSWLSTLGK